MPALLEKNYLASVQPDKGKFRSFLLASLNHFLANERDRVNAATANTIAAAVRRLRPRYRELVRAEIANTVSREEIEDEMHHLFSVLAH